MPSLLGTEVVALSSGTQNVTVPSGTQGVIAMGRAAGGDLTLTSSFAGTWTEAAAGGTTRLQYAPVTATGAQTITPSWGWGPSEGPVFVLFYVGGVDASAPANWIRDADDAETSSITVDSQSGDLVLAFDNAYSPTAAIPGLPSGWTSLATTAFGDLSGRARSLDTVGGPTTTVTTSPVAGTNFHGLCVVSVFGSASSDASGGLPPVQLAAPEASASGGAAATGAVDAIDLTAPQASISNGATASGSLDSVSLAAPQAAATGGSAASGLFDSIELAAPQASATGNVTGSGVIAGIQLTVPAGTATGGAAATGNVDAIDLSAPQATASLGSIVASGSLASVTLSAPLATATGAGTATGSFAPIYLVPPTGYAGDPPVVSQTEPVRIRNPIFRSSVTFSGSRALRIGR